MPNNETLGANFTIDTTNLKAGLAQANRAIRESESEFKAAAAGMDDWTQSAKGLEARTNHLNKVIDQHNSVIAKTKAEKDRVVKAMEAEGKSQEEINKAVDEANKILNKEYDALAKAQKELKQYGDEADNAAKDTDKLTDSTKKTGNGFSALKGAGKIGVAAIAAVAAAAVACVSSLLGLAESTRELRTNMAQLESGFTTAGLSAEDATETYKALYGVLGDEGQATEAAAHLAQLANNQKDLQKWTDIATGVYATFGASLPIESLTEAANETAKTGELTGALADALNWAGVNEDDFQSKLDAASSEQERQAIITETLNGLYSEQADKFKDLNKDIIESNEAQAELAEAQANLGAAAEPLNTMITTVKTSILTGLTPALKELLTSITDVVSGTEGATTNLANSLNTLISDILNKLVEVLPSVADGATQIILLIAQTLIENLPMIAETAIEIVVTLVNSIASMLPTLIPTFVEAVLLMAETLVNNIDKLIDAGLKLIEGLVQGITKALPMIVKKAPEIIMKLVDTLISKLPDILNTGVTLLLELVNGIMKAVPELVAKLPTIIAAIVKGLLTEGIPALITAGGNLLAGLFEGMLNPSVIWNNIKKVGNGILDGIKSFFGIKSPSKLFEDEIGTYLGEGMALGLGEGFADRIKGVNRSIIESMPDSISVGLNNNGAYSNASGRGGVTVNQYNTFSKAHSRYELFKSKQQTAAAVRLAVGSAI